MILNFTIAGKDLSRKNLYRLFLTAEPLPVRGFFYFNDLRFSTASQRYKSFLELQCFSRKNYQFPEIFA